MTFAELDRIDMWRVDSAKGQVRLVICDHMSWDERDGTAYLDHEEHLRLLQEKIWLYLNIVQGGELYEKIPEAKGMKVVIDVAMMYPISDLAESFFRAIRQDVEAEHCLLQVQHVPFDELKKKVEEARSRQQGHR